MICWHTADRPAYTAPCGAVGAEPLGFQNIEAFFRNRVNYVSGPQFKGCLLVKSAIEQGLLNVDARQKLHSFLAASDNAFYKCLDAAQQEGEIPQNSVCRTLAKYLMCPGGCDGVGTDESIKE